MPMNTSFSLLSSSSCTEFRLSDTGDEKFNECSVDSSVITQNSLYNNILTYRNAK